MSNCMACRISCPQVHRLSSASKRTSCAREHGLHQSHCGDNREGTLFLWLNSIYILEFTVKQYMPKKLRGQKHMTKQ